MSISNIVWTRLLTNYVDCEIKKIQTVLQRNYLHSQVITVGTANFWLFSMGFEQRPSLPLSYPPQGAPPWLACLENVLINECPTLAEKYLPDEKNSSWTSDFSFHQSQTRYKLCVCTCITCTYIADLTISMFVYLLSGS